MVKMSKIIERVDATKPNVYSEEDKFRWLAELDGMVAQTVLQEQEPRSYEFPKDMERELVIQPPWDVVYELYLMAKIDFYNKETASYNNTMTMYNELMDEFKKAYIRKHMPQSAGGFVGL